MPQDDVECNPPPDGYESGLESYLIKPLQEAFVTLLRESKNSSTGNLWFSHVSSWHLQPKTLLTERQFPAVFVLVPTGDVVKHGINQFAFNLTLQFEYYCRHFKLNITNELAHFVERLWYIIQTHPTISFGKIYGTSQLCAKKIGMDEGTIEFDFAVDGRHIIRAVTVTASAYVPLLMIEPP